MTVVTVLAVVVFGVGVDVKAVWRYVQTSVILIESNLTLTNPDVR